MTTPNATSDATEDLALSADTTRLGTAAEAFAAGKAKLYTSDGSPKYSDAEHTRRLGELHAALDATVKDAHETADQIAATWGATLAHLERADPLDALSEQELTTANARRVFVQEDAKALPASELVNRCTVAIQAGDKATAYLLARSVGERVRAANQVGHEGGKPEFTLTERVALEDLVHQLIAVVRGPEGKKLADKAKAKLQRAGELRMKARGIYDNAHESNKALEAALRATGRYSM